MIVSSICNAGPRLSVEELMETGKMMEHTRCPYSVDETSLTSFTTKRQKADFSVSSKDRKEKLGEKINALQQLVSPFGKTDTASVLLEAMEYIQFLHEQVKVLSAPYLQSSPMANNNIPSELLEAMERTSGLRPSQLCQDLTSQFHNFNDKLIEEEAEYGGSG